jgi:hypothetical protein
MRNTKWRLRRIITRYEKAGKSIEFANQLWLIWWKCESTFFDIQLLGVGITCQQMGIKSAPEGLWVFPGRNYRLRTGLVRRRVCRTQHFDKKTFSIHIFSSRKRDYVTCRCSYIMESKGAQKQLFDVSITRQQLLNSVSMEYCWLCSPPPPNLAVCWCANSTSKLSYSKAIPSESSSW